MTLIGTLFRIFELKRKLIALLYLFLILINVTSMILVNGFLDSFQFLFHQVGLISVSLRYQFSTSWSLKLIWAKICNLEIRMDTQRSNLIAFNRLINNHFLSWASSIKRKILIIFVSLALVVPEYWWQYVKWTFNVKLVTGYLTTSTIITNVLRKESKLIYRVIHGTAALIIIITPLNELSTLNLISMLIIYIYNNWIMLLLLQFMSLTSILLWIELITEEIRRELLCEVVNTTIYFVMLLLALILRIQRMAWLQLRLRGRENSQFRKVRSNYFFMSCNGCVRINCMELLLLLLLINTKNFWSTGRGNTKISNFNGLSIFYCRSEWLFN